MGIMSDEPLIDDSELDDFDWDACLAMLTVDKVPPAALEAMRAQLPPFFSERMARAACLAMLEAWPGMQHDNYVIVLPLPTEASDDKA